MKFLAVLFVPVVLGLSFLPCCSPMVSNSVQEIAVESSDYSGKGCCNEADNEPSNDNSGNSCDSCSPFFSCGSCCGFTFDQVSGYFSGHANLSSVTYPLFNLKFDTEYFESKWQPPKIS